MTKSSLVTWHLALSDTGYSAAGLLRAGTLMSVRDTNSIGFVSSFSVLMGEDANEYAALIRQESSPFLSDVKIEPNYPPENRPYDPTTFDATFEVSSVEFLNP